MTHELKTWPLFFEAIDNGKKKFEIRKNDRNYKLNDILWLREWDPVTNDYSGRELHQIVTFILHGGLFGIEEEYVVMSIEDQGI